MYGCRTCQTKSILASHPPKKEFLATVVAEDGSVLRYPLSAHIALQSVLLSDRAAYAHSISTDYLSLADKPALCSLASRSLDEKNAGGKSEVSEALSIQYFASFHGATEVVYERSVEYFVDFKMVDYVCLLRVGRENVRVGVSVTRGMNPPYGQEFTYADACLLLQKKLYGLVVARNAVCDKHSFFRSILHVFCQTEQIAQLIRIAYEQLDMNDWGLYVRGYVGLMLTVCDREEIYKNTRF